MSPKRTLEPIEEGHVLAWLKLGYSIRQVAQLCEHFGIKVSTGTVHNVKKTRGIDKIVLGADKAVRKIDFKALKQKSAARRKASQQQDDVEEFDDAEDDVYAPSEAENTVEQPRSDTESPSRLNDTSNTLISNEASAVKREPADPYGFSAAAKAKQNKLSFFGSASKRTL